MATSAVAVQSRFKTGVFVAFALLVAAGVGVAAGWDAKLGVAASLALIALPMAIVRPHYGPHGLMVSVCSASLAVGGTVTTGRAGAPLGLLAIAVYVLKQPV